MSLIVAKFGGSSVANSEKIKSVAQTACRFYRDGNDVVIVVSAQGDTTDELIAQAAEVSGRPSARELDMLMSAGEQMSAALTAMAIESAGCRAVSMTGRQAGFRTSSRHGAARIRKIETARIEKELADNHIVVVAGFQGLSGEDDITTLGRGGSDTSAMALAAALGADLCKIYTDVDGIYTADPRLVKNAIKLDEISYDEMLELASLGAQVLLNRSVELGKKYGVKIEVLKSGGDKPGTIVKEATGVESMVIRGVAKDCNVAALSVVGVPDRPGVAFSIFSALAAQKIGVDLIVQSTETNGTQTVSFTVQLQSADNAEALLRQAFSSVDGVRITENREVAKVSVVGTGMQSHTGVAAKMFETLYNIGINIHMISTSEIKISVLIDREDADRAVLAIHDAFFTPDAGV